MDQLPVELIADIAFLACRDGGCTGAALSLVSKRVRDASHQAQFYTVSLASCPERLAKFMNTYEAQCHRLPDTTSRVRHLFLSLLPVQGEPMFRVPALPFSEMFHAYDKYLASLRELGETYGPNLCALVTLLAPDLETLTFVRGEWKGVSSVQCAFPRLRELTLVDSCPEFLKIEDAPIPPAGLPLFPMLERLHTVEHFYARPIDLRLWAPHAPRLTHLRCSGLHHHNSPTAVSLQAVSACPLPSDQEDGGEVEFFPHLRHVLVQPTSTKSNPRYPWDGQRMLRADLQACATRLRHGLRFDVLPARASVLERLAEERAAGERPVISGGDDLDADTETAPKRCIRRAREGWLDRVEGRVGCWTEDYAF